MKFIFSFLFCFLATTFFYSHSMDIKTIQKVADFNVQTHHRALATQALFFIDSNGGLRKLALDKEDFCDVKGLRNIKFTGVKNNTTHLFASTYGKNTLECFKLDATTSDEINIKVGNYHNWDCNNSYITSVDPASDLENGIQVYDIAHKQIAHRFTIPRYPVGVCINQNNLILTQDAYTTNEIKVWDIKKSSEPLLSYTASKGINTFLPVDNGMIAGCINGRIIHYNFADQQQTTFKYKPTKHTMAGIIALQKWNNDIVALHENSLHFLTNRDLQHICTLKLGPLYSYHNNPIFPMIMTQDAHYLHICADKLVVGNDTQFSLYTHNKQNE